MSGIPAYFPGLCWNPSVGRYCGEYLSGLCRMVFLYHATGGRGFRSPCTLRQRSSSSGHPFAKALAWRMNAFPHETPGKRCKFSTGTMKTQKMAREKASFLLRHFFVFSRMQSIRLAAECRRARVPTIVSSSSIGMLLEVCDCTFRYRVQGRCPWRGGGAEPPIIPTKAALL